jgi:hypothetical protein
LKRFRFDEIGSLREHRFRFRTVETVRLDLLRLGDGGCSRFARPTALLSASVAAPAAALLFRRRLRRRLRLEHPRPFELHVGVRAFEQADGFFVDRGTADAHMRRRAEPVQDARLLTALAARRMKDVGVFVAAPVAAEPHERQIALHRAGARRSYFFRFAGLRAGAARFAGRAGAATFGFAARACRGAGVGAR